MDPDVSPSRFRRLQSGFRTLMHQRPFQSLCAQFYGYCSFLGSLGIAMQGIVQWNLTTALRARWPAAPMRLLIGVDLCSLLLGQVGCGLIGAWIGFLIGEAATAIARYRPASASVAAFMALQMPAMIAVPLIFALEARWLPVIAIVILSLIMSALVTFGFRLHGWPGPMSEKPARDVWREWREERRRRKTRV